jgi:branched-chain amino acid transport system substrate-binding protein
MIKPLYLFMILFLIATLTGCEDSEEISDSQDASNYAVKMGGIFPFSGALSEKGKPRHKAALLATKHLAEAGYPVGWAVADSETNPNTGVKVARELIEKGNVQVLIGPASSGVTKAIAQNVSLPMQIPHISYASTSVEISTLEQDSGYGDSDILFRTVPSDALQGVVLANLAFEKYRQVSVLYVNNAYGQSLSKVFSDNFIALGGTVKAAIPHPEVVNPELQGSETYLPQLRDAYTGETEALVAISYFRHVQIYIQEAKDNNLFHNFLFVGGSASKELVDIIKPQGALEGMCGTAPGVDKSTESYQIFEEAYLAEYDELPTEPAEWDRTKAYDAVIIAGLAAYAAEAIGETVTFSSLRDYLRRVANPDGQIVLSGSTELKQAIKMLDVGLDINYKGASGNVDFDVNGDAIAPIEIWCYEGKNLKPRDLCTVDLENQSSVECNDI